MINKDINTCQNDPDICNFLIHFIKNNSHNKEFKVLDIGCGDGSFIKSLINSNIGSSFYGTDVSDTMINMAKQNMKNNNANFFVADALSLPIKEYIKLD